MLKKIRDTQLFVASDVPTYLMTHPAVDDRIAYLDAWMASHPVQQDRGNTPESKQRFRRVRTRLVAGYGDKETALKEMSDAIKAHPDDPVVQHGYGIALARNDAPEKGAEYVRRALEKLPFDAVMLKDLGEINFMSGHYPEALAALRSSVAISPSDHETHYLLGRTLIALEQYPEAVRALKKVLTMVPEDRSAIWYLGEAYGKIGEMGHAHYYLGLHAFKIKDLKNARFHLQKAAQLLSDPTLKAEAEKRLAEMKKWPAPEETKASQ
jgi:predicted Zn-dependent protease